MFINFHDYIHSDHWRAKSAEFIDRYHGTCQCCGVSKATEVHHLTYWHNSVDLTNPYRTPNLYSEKDWELLPVCRDCHQRITEGRYIIIAPVLYPARTYPITEDGVITTPSQPIMILPSCMTGYFADQTGCDGYFDIMRNRMKGGQV